MPDEPGQNNRKPKPTVSPVNGAVLADEYKFKPGQSGNPGGRPSYKPVTEAYLRLGELGPGELESYEPKTIWEHKAKWMHLRESVFAAKEIADRVEGKSVETLSLQGNLGQLAVIASRRDDDEAK